VDPATRVAALNSVRRPEARSGCSAMKEISAAKLYGRMRGNTRLLPMVHASDRSLRRLRNANQPGFRRRAHSVRRTISKGVFLFLRANPRSVKRSVSPDSPTVMSESSQEGDRALTRLGSPALAASNAGHRSTSRMSRHARGVLSLHSQSNSKLYENRSRCRAPGYRRESPLRRDANARHILVEPRVPGKIDAQRMLFS